MRLAGRFHAYSVGEVRALLLGLTAQNVRQLRRGVPPISKALQPRARDGEREVRYIRRDEDETWWSIRDIWRRGGGDCEDLAAAVAAELQVQGINARADLYKVRPGLYHAIVKVRGMKGYLDPSKWGGMGEA